MTGFTRQPARANHSSISRRVLAPVSNSTSGRRASAWGEIRRTGASPFGAMATKASWTTGVMSRLRPVAGKVTSAASNALSSTRLRISGVFPVLTTISMAGILRLSWRSTGGSRWMHAVAPVPTRTSPPGVLAWRCMAASASSSASLMRAACSSSSAPACVGATRRPTRSTSRNCRRRSSSRIWWLTAGWVMPARSAAAVKLPSSIALLKVSR